MFSVKYGEKGNRICSYRRGQTKAATIGNIEAVQIAINNNAVIMFNEIAQAIGP